MPVGHHHYYYRDFMVHVSDVDKDFQAQMHELEEKERELRRLANSIRAERLHLSQGWLENNYQKVRPLMRPCHQKRFDRDGLKNAIEPELEGFI